MFFLQLRVIGSTMGTRAELASLTELLDVSGVRPVIDQVLPMEQARRGLRRDGRGRLFGKVVFTSCTRQRSSDPGFTLRLGRQSTWRR